MVDLVDANADGHSLVADGHSLEADANREAERRDAMHYRMVVLSSTSWRWSPEPEWTVLEERAPGPEDTMGNEAENDYLESMIE